MQVARAIYRDPVLSRYAMGAVPSIHVIVDNGKVTLTGAVNNDMEKQVAGIRASAAGLSFGPVVNNITVENPPRRKADPLTTNLPLYTHRRRPGALPAAFVVLRALQSGFVTRSLILACSAIA